MTDTEREVRAARRDSRSDQLRDVRATHAPVESGPSVPPASLDLAPLPPAIAEEYKSLRARIRALQRERSFRSIVVASSRRGEGKTTTALNLAATFGLELEFDTCLVDLDLRAPQIGATLRPAPGPGVTDVLSGQVSLEQALIPVRGTRLHVLPAGRPTERPSELLAASAIGELADSLHKRFAVTLVDSPPALGLPDTLAIVGRFDAVLLVACASATTARDLAATIERLDRVKVIGTVLNRAPEEPHGYSYAGYGYASRDRG